METDLKQNNATWLYGPPAHCASLVPGSSFRLLLLGAPGVGKGTQAQALARHYRVCHLSTGDVFRAAKKRPASAQTPALTAALEAMERGALVSDTIVSDMIAERMACIGCLRGFILDGFPRTIAQARMLQRLLDAQAVQLDAVVNFELPEEEIIARLSGRRTCERCRATFHLSSKPTSVAGICDQCGGGLYQREDDHPQSIRVRLREYKHSTAPLVSFYRELGLLVTIMATGTPEEIHWRTGYALKARSRS